MDSYCVAAGTNKANSEVPDGPADEEEAEREGRKGVSSFADAVASSAFTQAHAPILIHYMFRVCHVKD